MLSALLTLSLLECLHCMTTSNMIYQNQIYMYFKNMFDERSLNTSETITFCERFLKILMSNQDMFICIRQLVLDHMNALVVKELKYY